MSFNVPQRIYCRGLGKDFVTLNTFRLPKKLDSQLALVAKQLGWPMNTLMETVLDQFLQNSMKPKYRAKKMKTEITIRSIRIHNELNEKLIERAKELDMSKNQLVTYALNSYLGFYNASVNPSSSSRMQHL